MHEAGIQGGQGKCIRLGRRAAILLASHGDAMNESVLLPISRLHLHRGRPCLRPACSLSPARRARRERTACTSTVLLGLTGGLLSDLIRSRSLSQVLRRAFLGRSDACVRAEFRPGLEEGSSEGRPSEIRPESLGNETNVRILETSKMQCTSRVHEHTACPACVDSVYWSKAEARVS